ncbi:uncharacterized protein LOC114295447 [Camellia sinensis]|uniref:uncharacterized protein LOC114295447 n=1 Tax=Camellia sinensis TaxID=4442 RepID=UPI0010363018|nr:uncharacterized protein LOC114295447 [Camellia sinensis]
MVIPLSDSSQSDCDFDFEVLSLSIVSTTFYNLRKIDRILQNLLQLGDSSCGVRLCGFGTLRLLRSVRSEDLKACPILSWKLRNFPIFSCRTAYELHLSNFQIY